MQSTSNEADRHIDETGCNIGEHTMTNQGIQSTVDIEWESESCSKKFAQLDKQGIIVRGDQVGVKISTLNTIRLALAKHNAISTRIHILLHKLFEPYGEAVVEKIAKNMGWALHDLKRGFKQIEEESTEYTVHSKEEELQTIAAFCDIPLTKQLAEKFQKALTLSSPNTDFQAVCGNAFPVSIEGALEAMFKGLQMHANHRTPQKRAMEFDPTTSLAKRVMTRETKEKKRVSCDICSKAYCDRGALKVHISAVHNKELHKCTVDGCTETFTSRRSRNRHSSNRKLHAHIENKLQTVHELSEHKILEDDLFPLEQMEATLKEKCDTDELRTIVPKQQNVSAPESNTKQC